jgi:hypothetical protein
MQQNGDINFWLGHTITVLTGGFATHLVVTKTGDCESK